MISNLTLASLSVVALLAAFIVTVGVLILSKGRIYRSIDADSRPRRWVLILMITYFVAFCVWFPAWWFQRHELFTIIMGWIFGGLTITVWIASRLFWIVDYFIKKSGRDLT